MSREQIPSSFFVFTVVQHQGRFLVVRERKGAQGWYAPAGRLEAGESIAQAAVRETMEEAGVKVTPVSLLRIEQQWFSPATPGAIPSSWWRFVLTARPSGPSLTPKSFADKHSLEARWLPLAEIAALPLRHPEVLSLFALSLRERDDLDLTQVDFPAMGAMGRFAD